MVYGVVVYLFQFESNILCAITIYQGITREYYIVLPSNIKSVSSIIFFTARTNVRRGVKES